MTKPRPTKNWPGIVKLQEEMAELGVEITKLHARPCGNHWDNAEKGPLIQRVKNEMGDVLGALAFFMETNFSIEEDEEIQLHAKRKMDKFRGWHASEGMTGTKDP